VHGLAQQGSVLSGILHVQPQQPADVPIAEEHREAQVRRLTRLPHVQSRTPTITRATTR
jgi:hypothetical protein